MLIHRTQVCLPIKQRSYPIPTPIAPSIELSQEQQAELEKKVRRHKSEQRIALRSHIILLAATGLTSQAIAEKLGISDESVSKWRRRWANASAAITEAQTNGDISGFEAMIAETLSDLPRSGYPGDFTAYQVCRIIALAQEDPMTSGYPVSHWTPAELRQETIKREIVTDISARTVGRILNDADLQPHRITYWEYPGSTDDPQFQKETKTVCDTYEQALELAKQGGHTNSVDEKTGIQALGAPHPTQKMKPGQPERQEFTYNRNGTVTLIAGFDVATGQVTPSIGPTRTEVDFLEHIRKTVASDPQAPWVFVVDQLNTHKSESLVKFVTEQCRIETKLGVKGQSGILGSMGTRANFLSDPSHRIRFVYTPKHASWLNQIECWFSILVRRVLKRLRCDSVEELKQHILKFIDYFNNALAKPFKWTCKGKPLAI